MDKNYTERKAFQKEWAKLKCIKPNQSTIKL